jgi:hypothetical protein
MFFLQQNWRTRGWNRFCLEVGSKVAQIMYIPTSKCKNDTIKLKLKKIREYYK